MRAEASHAGMRKPEMNRCKNAKPHFTSLSGLDINRVYCSDDLKDWSPENDLGTPANSPTRAASIPPCIGAGSGRCGSSPASGPPTIPIVASNILLQHGQTGLSVAFDMPTLMGIDADDPRAHGEVGHCGVAISSLADMERLFEDIPLDQVTTSMTINGPAAVIFAMYLAVAEKRGIPLERLGGTLQNDILKEYIAQKEWLFPPEPSLRLITDTIAYCAKQVPKWHPVSISGYHIREAGSTAVQELAFTLYDGLTYVEAAVKAGLAVDSFAPQLSFFFNVHNDFFEEIAKFRAARRLWAREMERRYHPQRSAIPPAPLSCADSRLLADRAAAHEQRGPHHVAGPGGRFGRDAIAPYQLHGRNSRLPTEDAVKLALRTQQIIAHESEVTNSRRSPRRVVLCRSP